MLLVFVAPVKSPRYRRSRRHRRQLLRDQAALLTTTQVPVPPSLPRYRPEQLPKYAYADTSLLWECVETKPIPTGITNLAYIQERIANQIATNLYFPYLDCTICEPDQQLPFREAQRADLPGMVELLRDLAASC